MGIKGNPTAKFTSRPDLIDESVAQAEAELRRTERAVGRLLAALHRAGPQDPESLRLMAGIASEELFNTALLAALKDRLVTRRPGSGGRTGRPVAIATAGLARLEQRISA